MIGVKRPRIQSWTRVTLTHSAMASRIWQRIRWEDMMSKLWIVRLAVAAFAVFTLLIFASDLSAQFQPPGSLGALAPANIAKPRPKAPFDITGAWLHIGGESERFDPPAGFKL